MFKYLMVFFVGLGIGLSFYVNALGKLDALNVKYSIALPVACSNHATFSEAINEAEMPAYFQRHSNGSELWSRAKVNIIDECIGK